MNTFVNAINPKTANGAVTLASSGSLFVDLFSMIGSASDATQVAQLFNRCYAVDPALAIRIVLWSRDCRGGAGRRLGYREVLKQLCTKSPESILKMLPNLVDYGRYDDLVDLIQFPTLRDRVSAFLKESVTSNQLAAKWMPREKSAKKNLAKILMKSWGMDSKAYRKFLVDHSDTVETKMCAKEFDKIEYSHVPSVAMARYQNAFVRNDISRFAEFKSSLEKGETKVNASALYPHDVVRSVKSGGSIADAQWDALPDYIPVGVSILPIVDVSGSMGCLVSGSIRAIDISASLGIYLAERQSSAFKDTYITFHTTPSICTLPQGTFSERYWDIMAASWGGSTDFVKSMKLVLNHAVNNCVDPKDMPDYILCVSDMEFNVAGNATNLDAVKSMFAESGYEIPKLVFWNVNSRSNNIQSRKDENGVAMISGFSPSVLQAVLSGNDINPEDTMIATVMVARYDIDGVTI